MKQFSHEEIFAMAENLRGPYGLRKVIRWGHDDLESVRIESVAEHKHNAGVLGDFFMPIERAMSQVDIHRVQALLRYHDLPEIHPEGDIPQTMKNDAEDFCDDDKLEWVLEQVPAHMRPDIREAIVEFDARETLEAQVAFALDKLEPTFELYLHGVTRLVPPHSRCIPAGGTHGWTSSSRRHATEPFSVMYQFGEVLGAHIEKKVEEACRRWEQEQGRQPSLFAAQ